MFSPSWAGGVRAATVDEDPVENPLAEEEFEEQVLTDDEKEKGTQKELRRMEEFSVFLPVPASSVDKTKLVISTRWEIQPRMEDGLRVARARYVVREYKQRPHGGMASSHRRARPTPAG